MGLRTAGIFNSAIWRCFSNALVNLPAWERSQGIDERDVNSEKPRKSVGAERTLAEDIRMVGTGEPLLNIYIRN